MQPSMSFRVTVDLAAAVPSIILEGADPDVRPITCPLNDDARAGATLRAVASRICERQAEALMVQARAVAQGVNGAPAAVVKRRRRRRSSPAVESGAASPQLAPVAPVKASA